jgi:hypothetical protein
MKLSICQLKEFLGIFLLLCVIYLGYQIHKHRSQTSLILESYEDYNTNIDKQKFDATSLSDTQKNQVNDIFNSLVPNSISEYVNANKNILKGPIGPMGPMGQSGGTFISRGALINKATSYDGTNKNYGSPNRVVTRTSGNDPKTSLSFMDTYDPFATFQTWTLNSNNQLVSEYDQSCVAFNPAVGDAEKVYLTTCNDNAAVKLKLDKYNRMILQDSMGTPNQQCIVMGDTEGQILTTGVPDCMAGNDCFKAGFNKKFMKVKSCDVSVPKENEIWKFL